MELHHGHPLKSGYTLSENLEMYIKIIFNLTREKKVARVKDISDHMGVNKSSVTAALKVLAEKGLIDYDPYSFVDLTEKGMLLAKEIVNKYSVLSNFLINVLSVPRKIADDNACRMEHVIDNFVFERLVQFVNFINKGELSINLSKAGRKVRTLKRNRKAEKINKKDQSSAEREGPVEFKLVKKG